MAWHKVTTPMYAPHQWEAPSQPDPVRTMTNKRMGERVVALAALRSVRSADGSGADERHLSSWQRQTTPDTQIEPQKDRNEMDHLHTTKAASTKCTAQTGGVH